MISCDAMSLYCHIHSMVFFFSLFFVENGGFSGQCGNLASDIFFFFEQPAAAAFTVILLNIACVHKVNTYGNMPECERCKLCG